jgi:polysaccharide export outer membrane protein
MKSIKAILTIMLVFVSILMFTSCANSKKITIFRELQHNDSSVISPNLTDNTIKPGDNLQITVHCPDEKLNLTLNNIIGGSGTGASGAAAAPSYLVDDSGYIKFPLLGELQCLGMTRELLEDKIKYLLISNKYVLDAFVMVRLANFRITVLGEVNRPGVINIPNEKANIIEAIGMAGDLSVYAKRDNLLLIREVNGKRVYKRFSMNDPQLFNKDYFNIQNQDIIYVEPIKAKASSVDNRSSQAYSMALTTLSILLLVYTQLFPK